MADLYQKNRTFSRWNTGAAYLHFLYEGGMHRLVTGIECEFLAIGTKQIVLLDTGAEWSVAGYEIFQSFSDENALGNPLGKKRISSRLGSFEGHLYRIDVCLPASWGESLTMEGTAEIPCPAPGEDFYGQDAQYVTNPRSYTKLDAGGNDLPDSASSWTMVRDNVTGLR